MYTLKISKLLKERYPKHFLDSVHKLANPVFAKPCSYSNTVMRLPLREKIQNAINRAVAAADGSGCNYYQHYYNDPNNNDPEKNGGALIVGGRRRTRKKKNKKNGQQKKKKSSPGQDIKGRLSPSGYRKGGSDPDHAQLINDEQGKGYNHGIDNEGMPFWKGKKEQTVAGGGEENGAVTTVAEENGVEALKDTQVATDTEKEPALTKDAVKDESAAKEDAKEEAVKKNEVEEKVEEKKDEKAEEPKTEPVAANGTIPETKQEVEKVELTAKDQDSTATFVKEVDGGNQETEDANASAVAPGKSEKSPLITKEPEAGDSSNLTVPGAADLNVDKGSKGSGFLCCAIL